MKVDYEHPIHIDEVMAKYTYFIVIFKDGTKYTMRQAYNVKCADGRVTYVGDNETFTKPVVHECGCMEKFRTWFGLDVKIFPLVRED